MKLLKTCIASGSFICGAACALLQTQGAEWSRSFLVDGHLMGWVEGSSGENAPFPIGDAFLYFSHNGSNHVPSTFRALNTEPLGWWKFEGDPGLFSILAVFPDQYLRPAVWSPLPVLAGERMHGYPLKAAMDFGRFEDKEWDPKPASAYYQVFKTNRKSVTNVSFKMAHDGVDGDGPGKQDIVVAVLEVGSDQSNPDTWRQIGPERVIENIDGGPDKHPVYTAAWNSGETPLTPGNLYAVRLATRQEGQSFQVFWSNELTNASAVQDVAWRISNAANGWERTSRRLWMSVDGDGAGLLIPYNKISGKAYGELGGFAQSWSQHFIAQGSSLAGAVLYAAVGGTQPPIYRQKTLVSVHEGSPKGPIIGVQKIAVGVGNYTGDASWGAFGAAFAPGETPLKTGIDYWIRWQTLETDFTIGNYVNSKGIRSSGTRGFNPYIQSAAVQSSNLHGSVKNDQIPMSQNLDAIIITYDNDIPFVRYLSKNEVHWKSELIDCGDPLDVLGGMPVFSENLIQSSSGSGAGLAEADIQDLWSPFMMNEGVRLEIEKRSGFSSRQVDVFQAHDGGLFGKSGGAFDGGWVRTVNQLDPQSKYIFSGWIRSSYGLGLESQANIGWDESGQGENSESGSIEWSDVVVVPGLWTPFQSSPIKPFENKISCWLRASGGSNSKFQFRAEFADLQVRQIKTELNSPATSPKDRR